MLEKVPYIEALELMLGLTAAMPAQTSALEDSLGYVLAEDMFAETDVPPFDRSPYDGYALRMEDTLGASRERPLTLRVNSEIAAGQAPRKPVTAGTAAKILTGGPLPEGADAVIMYEMTEFTEESVSIFEPVTQRNIVLAGEDIKKGQLIAAAGSLIDPGLVGALAAQGFGSVPVFKKPRAGIISTGDELVGVSDSLYGGKIRNTNRYVLEGALRLAGAEPVVLGTAKDSVEDIAALIRQGLEDCDLIFSTGGVSAGDYDRTPEAIHAGGAELLLHRVIMKPGGSCAYGAKGDKLIFGLSGNPAAAMVNFYAIALPCLRKMRGLREYRNTETMVSLAKDFNKGSPNLRFLLGRLDISGGRLKMDVSERGNGSVHSLIGCDVLAMVPPGSPKLKAGTELGALWIK